MRGDYVSPEQLKYNRIRYICEQLYGASNVHDFLPDDAPYPFIHVGEQFKQNVRDSKDHINRPTQITVHVWHNKWEERGTVAMMMYQIEMALIKQFGYDNISTQIMPDTSAGDRTARGTGIKLVHGILEINIGGI